MSKASIRKYYRATRNFVEATKDMPTGILLTYLGVVMWGDTGGGPEEPIKLDHLAQRREISPTTLSQHLRYLGDGLGPLRPGLGLVETFIYPFNRRQKICRLTPKGRALAHQLAATIEYDAGTSTGRSVSAD